MLNACSGMLFSNKKEQTTDTCYNTEEPQKHYAKLKKSNGGLHSTWFHIYEWSGSINLYRDKM